MTPAGAAATLLVLAAALAWPDRRGAARRRLARIAPGFGAPAPIPQQLRAGPAP